MFECKDDGCGNEDIECTLGACHHATNEHNDAKQGIQRHRATS